MGAALLTPPVVAKPWPLCQVRRVSSTQVFNANVWSTITFDTVDIDNCNGMNGALTSYNIPEVGTYAVEGIVHILNVPNDMYYGVRVIKNGAVIFGSGCLLQGNKTANSRVAVPSKRVLVPCNAGDYIQLMGYMEGQWQSQEASDGYSTQLTVERVPTLNTAGI